MQAILITAYKNIEHLKSIINFFDSRFSIYIHIDKKSSIELDDIYVLSKYENVKYVSKKYKINWGGLNHLRAILDLSEKAIENTHNSYFHLITGHDYPIQKLDYFMQFEIENSNKIFMEYHALPYYAWPEGGIDRLSRYNFYDLVDGRSGWKQHFIKKSSKLQKLLRIKRKFSPDFPKLYGGSTYWSMSREALYYVFSYMKNNPKYLERFKYSFCSEEIFFQSILLNSELSSNIINNNLRFIVWEKRNGNFPANLDLTDYQQIKESKALFARKFEYPVSEQLFSKIYKDIKKSAM